jgi:hypothetical protein
METYGAIEAVIYLVQPAMLLAYTAAAVMCQGLVALIRWSDQMGFHRGGRGLRAFEDVGALVEGGGRRDGGGGFG